MMKACIRIDYLNPRVSKAHVITSPHTKTVPLLASNNSGMTSKSKKIILITLGPLLLCGVWLCLLKDEPTKSNNHPWMHNDRRDESSLAVEPAAIVTQIHQDVAVTTVEKDKAHALVPNSINASSSEGLGD